MDYFDFGSIWQGLKCWNRQIDIALTIDLLELVAIEFNPKTGKTVQHKFPPADDSNLRLSVINILNYLSSKIDGNIKWIVFAGDLSQNQQDELIATASDVGIETIYFCDKFEGLHTFLIGQLHTDFAPFEPVAMLLDRNTYAIVYLWRQINGQLVRVKEMRIQGTGISNMLTYNDLKMLKNEQVFCKNWVIEANENRILLENFFDYQIHEIFLRVGLSDRWIIMMPYFPDNYVKGAVMKSKNLAGEKSFSYISKEFISEERIIETSVGAPQCSIL